MIVAPIQTGSFAKLPDRTWLLLQCLGVTEAASIPELAAPDDGSPEVCITTAHWQVGAADQALAECRIVRVQGLSEELVQTVLFPACPKHLPTFVALLWQACDDSCHAYINLATPGMAAPLRDDVSEFATVLSIRHAAFLARAATTSLPSARVLSASGLAVHEHTGHGRGARIAQAYEDYLQAWLDFAVAVPAQRRADAYAQRELLEYKQQLAAHVPGKEAYRRLCSEDWMHRFLGEFLYR